MYGVFRAINTIINITIMEIKYNKIQEIVENAVFPIIIEETCGQGLTKRELFAAMALQGMLASETSSYNYGAIECLAENAVKKADALITELNKKDI